MHIRIRSMTGADTHPVSGIVAADYRLLAVHDGFTAQQLQRLLTERCTADYLRDGWLTRWECYVAESDARIVGVVAIDGNEIAELWVAPERHHQGIGATLFRYAEGVLRDAGHRLLTLHCATRTARLFYLSMGCESRARDLAPAARWRGMQSRVTASSWHNSTNTQRNENSMLNKQRIHEIAQKTMGKRKGLLTREVGYLLHHGQRVATLARNLCAQVECGHTVEQDILYTAGLFHDVGKGIEPHAETSAALAQQLLQDVCTPDECAQIASLIQRHNTRGDVKQPLAVHILQDADILDHIGAQSIWLCFTFNAYTKKGPVGALAYYMSDDNQRVQQRWRTLLNLEVAREVFDQRMTIERQFMQRFAEEMAGAF
ncbi:MAG TPA: GNAT family N-acetyltransferase [Armatimonadota bacterium]|jgi:uncharacterized protein